MTNRYSKISHEATPDLKTAHRLERRMRRATAICRRHIWLGTSIIRGDVLMHTSTGTLRILPDGAAVRA